MKLRVDPLFFKLAARNIVRNRIRSTLALLAITLSTSAIILASGFVEDIFHELREATIRAQLGHMQVRAQAQPGERTPLIENPAKVHKQLERIPGVNTVLDRLQFSGLLNNSRTDYPIQGEGVEPEKEAKTSTAMEIIEGRNLRNDDDHGILLGSGVAQALKLKPGDSATLLVSTPAGATNSLDVEVAGIFRTVSREYDARAVRIQIGAARDLLAEDGASSIVVFLDDTEQTESIAARIAPSLAPDKLEVKRWDELADFYQKAVDLYGGLLAVMKTIAIGAVLLSVINCISLGIHERTREFGTLRALGNQNRDVYMLILVESAFLGVVGATLGCLCGLLGGWLLSAIGIPMPPPPNGDVGYIALIRVLPRMLAESWLLGLCASIIGGLIAGRRASQLEIATALRHN